MDRFLVLWGVGGVNSVSPPKRRRTSVEKWREKVIHMKVVVGGVDNLPDNVRTIFESM